MSTGDPLHQAFEAARALNHRAIGDYLNSGGDPNITEDGTGQRLLCIAAENGDIETGELLLEHGAEPNVASHAWPIHFAAGHGHIKFVKLLLDHDSEVHCLDEDGGTPLADAAAAGHCKIVELLLEAGADPTYRDRHGKRAILYAAENGQNDVVHILNTFSSTREREIAELKLKFAGDNRPREEFTKVKIAAARGNLDPVIQFIENGGDPNECDIDGDTFLMSAANRGRIDVLRYLLEQGADPNQLEENGGCALDFSINAETPEAYELLYPLTDEKHRRRVDRDKERKRKAGFLTW